MSDEPKVKCMVPDCSEKARWKGICGQCYYQAKSLIEANKTTWEELSEMGLCVEPKKKLLTAFNAKKRQEKDDGD